ncbi:MAG: hypothetical protein IKE65_09725 [Clostridia bacterium]|nr:hypothetical protein [Clostridia bacterium]
MSVKKRVRIVIFVFVFLVLGIVGFILLRAGLSAKVPAVEKTAEHRSVYFGQYPQSMLKDEALIAKLNKLEAKWQSYGYYNGNGAMGSAKQSDYAQYADVVFAGKKYRAVRLSQYRSHHTHGVPQVNWQSERFELNKTYWFKYEPIEWIVLSEEEHLLMSKMLLDSQPINNVIYSKTPELDLFSECYYKDPDFRTFATDYASSDIRQWLNDDFYKTAFSQEEAQRIVESNLDNSAWSRRDSKFNSADTVDKVFLLSYDEAKNPAYGFYALAEKEQEVRTGFGTDYAFSQGMLGVTDSYHNGTMWWWLRSAAAYGRLNVAVNFQGSIRLTFDLPYAPDCTDSGIRPALRLDSLDK